MSSSLKHKMVTRQNAAEINRISCNRGYVRSADHSVSLKNNRVLNNFGGLDNMNVSKFVKSVLW